MGGVFEIRTLPVSHSEKPPSEWLNPSKIEAYAKRELEFD
jgi:hypothetical protein